MHCVSSAGVAHQWRESDLIYISISIYVYVYATVSIYVYLYVYLYSRWIDRHI